MFGKDNKKFVRILGIVLGVVVIVGMLAMTFPILLLL